MWTSPTDGFRTWMSERAPRSSVETGRDLSGSCTGNHAPVYLTESRNGIPVQVPNQRT
ncbi:hypothetical protein Q4E40_04200 [Pontibacter sp. BT731]|uniref:hypothetical protein n=1 Tax=Pontibacter coccineus TaxID=3063328 RepID=UPI0026E1E709|nr:hypothetical protein [Pontibacter sp. BT731]MDO6389316.1 hypothetical protein [Pontibacter sp. BT731]